jgi:hypothetical protein
MDNKSFQISDYIRVLTLTFISVAKEDERLPQGKAAAQILTSILQILINIIPLFEKLKEKYAALFPDMPTLKTIDEEMRFFNKMIAYNAFYVNKEPDTYTFVNIIGKYRDMLGVTQLLQLVNMDIGVTVGENVTDSDQRIWIKYVEPRWNRLQILIKETEEIRKERTRLERESEKNGMTPYEYHIQKGRKGGSYKKSSNNSAKKDLFKIYKDGYTADMKLVQGIQKKLPTIDSIILNDLSLSSSNSPINL